MQYQLMKLDNNIEEQTKSLFEFILEKGDITELANPRTLVEDWHSGAIKIFVAKENNEIKAVKVILVIKDPIYAMKYHLIESLAVGINDQGFNAYVESALDMYR